MDTVGVLVIRAYRGLDFFLDCWNKGFSGNRFFQVGLRPQGGLAIFAGPGRFLCE